jgi:hypothetical protein
MEASLKENLTYHPSINAMKGAAGSVLKLQSFPHGTRNRQQGEKELRALAINVSCGYFEELEGMLAAQAQMLHAIFTHAADRYAEAHSDEKNRADEKKVKLYSTIALKAQSYCRQTVAALARIKKSWEYNEPRQKNIVKSRNELLRREPLPALSPDEPYEALHAQTNAPIEPKAPSAKEWIKQLQQTAGG